MLFTPEIEFYPLGFENDYHLSTDFTISELYYATKLVDSEYLTLESIPLHRNAIDVAQYLRDQLNTPINISSAYRSVSWENEKGRDGTSSHTKALAIDLNSSPNNDVLTQFVYEAYTTKNYVYSHLKALGINSYGFYDWGVHLDFRERKIDNTDRFWDYRVKKKVIT